MRGSHSARFKFRVRPHPHPLRRYHTRRRLGHHTESSKRKRVLILNLITILHLTPFFTEWHGLDTLIVAAGVSALRPVLEIAGVDGPSVTQPTVEGIQKVEDVAMAAIKGNYLGPLLSVVTMVCLRSHLDLAPLR